MSIVSEAKTVSTTSSTYLNLPPGASFLSVQNHDAVNAISVKFGTAAATGAPNPNGVVIKAGEYFEIKFKNLVGKVNAIAEGATVNTTVVYG